MATTHYSERFTAEEEARLPLPKDWLRVVKVVTDPDTKKNYSKKIYRNINYGQELEEHPLIVRANTIAKRQPLPFGWTIQEDKSNNNSLNLSDIFYHNATLRISTWDHPLLRPVLGQLLEKEGYDPNELGLNFEPLTIHEIRKSQSRESPKKRKSSSKIVLDYHTIPNSTIPPLPTSPIPSPIPSSNSNTPIKFSTLELTNLQQQQLQQQKLNQSKQSKSSQQSEINQDNNNNSNNSFNPSSVSLNNSLNNLEQELYQNDLEGNSNEEHGDEEEFVSIIPEPYHQSLLTDHLVNNNDKENFVNNYTRTPVKLFPKKITTNSELVVDTDIPFLNENKKDKEKKENRNSIERVKTDQEENKEEFEDKDEDNKSQYGDENSEQDEDDDINNTYPDDDTDDDNDDDNDDDDENSEEIRRIEKIENFYYKNKKKNIQIERDWEGLLRHFSEPEARSNSHMSYRIGLDIKNPTLSPVGLKVLRNDIVNANERVHDVLVQLRSILALRNGYKTVRYLYRDDNMSPNTDEKSQESNNKKKLRNYIITLASDIITTLRQQPEWIIKTMNSNSNYGNSAMLQIAFLSLHRLLHPFSCDSSFTTSLLLNSLNFQLEEMSLVEKIFSINDSKIVLSRALLIHDPIKAIEWNPLHTPLPLLPNPGVEKETIFISLLRVYSIRRDVTSYYRSLWKPFYDTFAALLNHSPDIVYNSPLAGESVQFQDSNPFLLSNLISLAYRFIENTLFERSLTVFPISGTAILRAINEIGGSEIVLITLLNVFILPNLVKILSGDHDSIDSELPMTDDVINKSINKYFDFSWWMDFSDFTGNNLTEDDSIILVLRSFVWVVWRMITCAHYMSEPSLNVLSLDQFLMINPENKESSPMAHMNLNGVKEQKLRVYLSRLKIKINNGISWILRLPVDLQASEYFGVEETPYFDENILLNPSPNNTQTSNNTNLTKLKSLQHHVIGNHIPVNVSAPIKAEIFNLLDQRLSALKFKPKEMLNTTVISKRELLGLLADIGCTMDELGIDNNSPLYRYIFELVNIYGNKNDKQTIEELLLLTFIYEESSNSSSQHLNSSAEYDNSESDLLKEDLKYLFRSLKMCNRYEDTLLYMLNKIKNNEESSLLDLITIPNLNQNTPDKKLNYTPKLLLEPEFEIELKTNRVPIAEKHTINSKNKIKNPLYGLQQPKIIKIFPLFSQHNNEDYHPNTKSMIELQNEVLNSYRFGSGQKGVDVGTSMGRKKLIPPKLSGDSVKVTVNNNRKSFNSFTRSNYTEVILNSNSSLLNSTQASRNHSKKGPETLIEKDAKFMSSLRNHSVIDSNDFKVRYHKKGKNYSSNNSLNQINNTVTNHDKKNKYNFSSSVSTLTPLPFPEHLRHLIRQDDKESLFPFEREDDKGLNLEDLQNVNQLIQNIKNNNNNDSNYYDNSGEDSQSPVDFFSSLISDYQSTVRPLAKKISSEVLTPSKSITSSHSPTQVAFGRSINSTVSRRGLGHLPKPLEGSNLYRESPCLLKKFEDDNYDVNYDNELRKYTPESQFNHDKPFVNTKNKIYPIESNRIYPKPKFLEKEDDYNTIGCLKRCKSPTCSRNRSKSRSRSNSPLRSPSINGQENFLKSTISSELQRNKSKDENDNKKSSRFHFFEDENQLDKNYNYIKEDQYYQEDNQFYPENSQYYDYHDQEYDPNDPYYQSEEVNNNQYFDPEQDFFSSPYDNNYCHVLPLPTSPNPQDYNDNFRPPLPTSPIKSPLRQENTYNIKSPNYQDQHQYQPQNTKTQQQQQPYIPLPTSPLNINMVPILPQDNDDLNNITIKKEKESGKKYFVRTYSDMSGADQKEQITKEVQIVQKKSSLMDSANAKDIMLNGIVATKVRISTFFLTFYKKIILI